ncbi:hypothetical protein CesoFtcFv8_004375 [Champsocephalus esox]|uniref:Uncharacterized protein n=1 Tax=Champsocephalus esox TaxID=159716 RepID=A0AAN8HCG8_9TELE|nr:hypothetical protein CesoFtcFv8_004375 [Champsocephalus esox]
MSTIHFYGPLHSESDVSPAPVRPARQAARGQDSVTRGINETPREADMTRLIQRRFQSSERNSWGTKRVTVWCRAEHQRERVTSVSLSPSQLQVVIRRAYSGEGAALRHLVPPGDAQSVL